MKFLVLIILVIFWQNVFLIAKKIKENDPKTKTFIKYFLIYFSIMIVFLVITWPGVWRHDEFYILDGIVTLNFNCWHHWLTSLYYMICLCILPFPSGIILIQITLISAIVSSIITQFDYIYQNQKNWLIMIPLLFPSIIINNLYPLRMPIYSFIEIFLLSLITFKYLDKSDISYKNILFWSLLISIVSSWRSESIFCILALPIVIFILLKAQLSIKKVIVLFLATILISSSIIYIQKKDTSANAYIIMAILAPMREIVKTDFKSNDKEGDLNTIGKIFNIKGLKSGRDNNDIWEITNPKFSDKDLYELEKVYVKLIIYNLPSFAKERLEYFERSNQNIEIPNWVMNEGARRGALLVLKTQDLEQSYKKFRFLEFRDKNKNYYDNFLTRFFYSPVTSAIILLLLLFTGIITRNILLFFLSLLITLQTIATIIGASANLFMYYLPCYIYTGITTVMLILIGSKNIFITKNSSKN